MIGTKTLGHLVHLGGRNGKMGTPIWEQNAPRQVASMHPTHRHRGLEQRSYS